MPDRRVICPAFLLSGSGRVSGNRLRKRYADATIPSEYGNGKERDFDAF